MDGTPKAHLALPRSTLRAAVRRALVRAGLPAALAGAAAGAAAGTLAAGPGPALGVALGGAAAGLAAAAVRLLRGLEALADGAQARPADRAAAMAAATGAPAAWGQGAAVLAGQLEGAAIEAHAAAAAIGQALARVEEAVAAGSAEVADGTARLAALGREAAETLESCERQLEALAPLRKGLAEAEAARAERVRRVLAECEALGGLIRMVREVADETNLLALNAAIKAARAGERGRGFAVVAEAVRALSLRAVEAADRIEAGIGRVVGGIRARLEGAADEDDAGAAGVLEAAAGNLREMERAFRETESALRALLEALPERVGRIEARVGAARGEVARLPGRLAAVEDAAGRLRALFPRPPLSS